MQYVHPGRSLAAITLLVSLLPILPVTAGPAGAQDDISVGPPVTSSAEPPPSLKEPTGAPTAPPSNDFDDIGDLRRLEEQTVVSTWTTPVAGEVTELVHHDVTGDLLVSGSLGVRRYSSSGTDLGSITALPHARVAPHGDIVVHDTPTGLAVFDLTTGTQTAFWDIGEPVGFGVVGDRVWFNTPSDNTISSVPITGGTPTVETLNGLVIHLESPEHLMISVPQLGPTVFELDGDDLIPRASYFREEFEQGDGWMLSVDDDTGRWQIASIADPTNHHRAGTTAGRPRMAIGGDRIFTSGNDILDAATGAEVGRLGFKRPGAIAAAPDGRTLYAMGSDGGTAVLHAIDVRPDVQSSDQQFYDPVEAPTIALRGWNMAMVDSVTVNGSPATFSAPDATTLLVDAPPVDSPTATIEVGIDGETDTFEITARLARGEALLTIGFEHSGTSSENGGALGFSVRCVNDRGTTNEVASGFEGLTTTLVVPGGAECIVYGGWGNARVRSSAMTSDGEVGRDLFGESFPFDSGPTARVFFTFEFQAEAGEPIWVQAFGAGATSLRLRIDCQFGFDADFRLDVGFSRRITVLPGSTTCDVTADPVSGRAVRVLYVGVLYGNSFVDDITDTGRFDPTRSGYLAVLIDDDSADFWHPVVVGSPGEAIGSRAGAGMVHVIPTRDDGSTDTSRSLAFRQGTNRIAGSPESGDGFGSVIATGDFDRNGYVDVAIGVPGEDLGSRRDAGLVQVIYLDADGPASRGPATFHQNSPGVPGVAEANDEFGAALAVVDYNADGYPDLAVGVPGEALGSRTDAGMVNILVGGPDGLTGVRSESLHQDRHSLGGVAEAGDRFGAALAGQGTYLLVGSPGEAIGSRTGAGMAHHVDGYDFASATIRQDNNMGGAAEAGDAFGSNVAMLDSYAVIGAPGEDVGSMADAGAVNVMRGFWPEAPGYDFGEVVVQSELPGLGRVEPGDRFGEAIDMYPGEDYPLVVIGVPREDNGSIVDTGVVHVFEIRGETNPAELVSWLQSSPGVPGNDEANDAFGASVHFTWWGGLTIGSPGEDLGATSAAGNVVTLGANGWSTINQSTSGVAGSAEQQDNFGGAVGG